MLLDSDAEAAGIAVDDSYLFNLDGEEKGQVTWGFVLGALRTCYVWQATWGSVLDALKQQLLCMAG